MSKVEMVQHTVMPAAKSFVKEAASKAHVSAPIAETTASAADALSAQGQAMVKMGKKPYVKPEMKTVEVDTEQTILAGSYGEGGGGHGPGWYPDEGDDVELPF